MEKEDKIYKIRHSLAHILAIAVLEKFPNAKLAIGPAVENGFYYDFDFGEKTFSDADLKQIQKQMKKLSGRKFDFEFSEISEKEAREIFKDQPYKLELIDEIVKKGGKISVYKTGDFVDLCEGPHVENSSEINTDAFKLEKLAGAYWRGDEKNKMLTRIYGLAFETKEELVNYQKMLEEAKKRDHRKLGKELDLFTFSELVGSGLPLFTPKGTLLRDLIVEKIDSLQKEYGYKKVTIPHITKKDLYEVSGHWKKFGDELFRMKGKQGAEFVMKPMNCPHHTQIFASKQRSYKDLPLRYVETTMVYRDEQQGELLGLSRVRSITQDDGHVFCREDQIEGEIKNIVKVIAGFYKSLNMFSEGDFWVSLSVRDSKNLDGYIGREELWEKAENFLEKVAKEESLPYKKVEGEAAFYGPKLDFMFRDALGREWQLATAQLDFVMPKRFELEYVDEKGEKQTPVMVHRAIAGSLERFLSVIIEHFAGAFPFWLSPVQVKILPIAEPHNKYAKEVFERLKKEGVRVELDDENESLGKKIRKGKTEKVPYLFVIGDKEVESKTVTAEGRGDEKMEGITIEEFLKKVL